MEVKVGALIEPLEPLKAPRGRRAPKPVVTLESDATAGTASVTEAHNAIFSETIHATGYLPGSVQIDGIVLRNMVSGFPPETMLSLEADAGFLVIRVDKTTLKITRFDGCGTSPVETMPLPRQQRYKITVKPAPVRKRVVLADT